MNNVCIVGHGTSVKINRLGYLIDSHDAVVRIKAGIKLSTEFPDSFGSRTTHVCLASEVLSGSVDLKSDLNLYPPDVEKWLYDVKPYSGEFIREQDEIAFWTARYRAMKIGNIPFFSTGTAAVVFACKRLQPRRLSLFGFDAYRHPGGVYTNSFGKVLRVGHEWVLERLLVEEIANKSNVQLNFVE